jgi:hypothetical protein
MKGLLAMPTPLDQSKATVRDDRLHVPTKAEILSALQHDSGRGGLALEWMLDRCDRREGAA